MKTVLWGFFIGLSAGACVAALVGDWRHFAVYCVLAYAAETGAIEQDYRSDHEQRSLSTSMAKGASWLPRAQDAGVSSGKESEAVCADTGHKGEGPMREITKASVKRERVIYLEAVPLEWILEPCDQQRVRQILSDNMDKICGIPLGENHGDREC